MTDRPDPTGWWVSENDRDLDQINIYGPDGDAIAVAQANLDRGWSAWEVAQAILRPVIRIDPDQNSIERLQRLHHAFERAVREAEQQSNPDPRDLAHLGGRIVGIRRALAALGATEVRTDTGVRSLAEYAPRAGEFEASSDG